jgi:hypothetical protein
MSTSHKQGRKILGVISPRDAERLLLAWANLPDLPYPSNADAACGRLISQNPEVFSFIPLAETDALGSAMISGYFMEIRHLLRRAWVAPDRRHRDWYLFHLRKQFHQWKSQSEWWSVHPPVHPDWATGEEAKGLLEREAEPPEITHFEAAVFYLQTSVAERAKYCGGPHCPAPYFVATKRWQKYCTEECAGPALRESKRRWWTENRAKNGGNQ